MQHKLSTQSYLSPSEISGSHGGEYKHDRILRGVTAVLELRPLQMVIDVRRFGKHYTCHFYFESEYLSTFDMT
jgi:hypothetical protein